MTPTTTTPTNESVTRARRVYSSQEKSELLALYAQSEHEMTAAEFCEEMGVKESTFSLWRRQADTGAAAVPDFAEVRIVPSSPAASATVVTITTPSGAMLSVPAGTDPVWVGQLAQSLR